MEAKFNSPEWEKMKSFSPEFLRNIDRILESMPERLKKEIVGTVDADYSWDPKAYRTDDAYKIAFIIGAFRRTPTNEFDNNSSSEDENAIRKEQIEWKKYVAQLLGHKINEASNDGTYPRKGSGWSGDSLDNLVLSARKILKEEDFIVNDYPIWKEGGSMFEKNILFISTNSPYRAFVNWEYSEFEYL